MISNKYVFYCFLFLIILITSCGKEPEHKDELPQKIEEDRRPVDIPDDPLNDEDYDRQVGLGYLKMSHSFKQQCLKNFTTVSPSQIHDTTVNYQDDMDEQQLRNILDIDISASIPIQGIINLNPRLQFSRDAATTTLSHTSTYFVYSKLGNKKMTPDNSGQIKIKPEYRSFFDEHGKLKNISDFTKICGDELVTDHILSSKLVITAKVYFKNVTDKNSFELNLGVSPSVAPQWSLNFKIKDIDIQMRSRMRMVFYATQIGGKPDQLLSLLGQNSCTLDKIEDCQKIMDRFSTYVSTNYINQLSPNDTGLWTVERLGTIPYTMYDVYDDNGNRLDFNVLEDNDKQRKLLNISQKIQTTSATEVHNLFLASVIKGTNYIATDETQTLKDIISKSIQNILKIRNFSSQCYENLDKCFIDFDTGILKTLIDVYDTTLLETNFGTLVAKTYSYLKDKSFFEKRSSDDFVKMQPDLANGTYSSYYFKFKTLKNVVINDKNSYLDIRCANPFIFSSLLIQKVFQKYEIMNNTMAINYKKKCSDQYSLFIASPVGFEQFAGTDDRFIVELWGRN